MAAPGSARESGGRGGGFSIKLFGLVLIIQYWYYA